MNSDLEQLEIKEVNRKIGELLEQAVFTKVLNVKKSDLIKEIYKIDKKIFNYLKNEV